MKMISRCIFHSGKHSRTGTLILARKIVLLLIGILLHTVLFAAEEGIAVKDISVEAKHDTVFVRADLQHLFSKKIIGMIDSGLPSIIETELRIRVDSSDKTVWQKKHLTRIEYDLWGERYLVTDDTVRSFPDFESVRDNCEKLTVKSIRVNSLESGVRLVVQIRVHLFPISSEQASKAYGWLTNPSQTEENLPSDERSSGFSLNLNRLISFFVNKKKSNESNWYESPPFSPSDLAR